MLPENVGLRNGGAVKLPNRPVSLILQFKVPEFLRGGRAKQWNLWHRPYFRFAKSNQQQGVLARLENTLGSDVIVRYAAPAFYRQADLEIAQLARLVIAKSGHVSPRELAKHRVWTFIEPGVDGRANPSGPFRPFEPLEISLATASRPLSPSGHAAPTTDLDAYEGLRSHLSSLADSVRERNPTVRDAVRRWAFGLRGLDLTPQQTLDLLNFVSVQTAVAHVGAAWFLIDPDAR